MSAKLGPDAFAVYVAMGQSRSYSRVADHYGVSKQSVVRLAGREDWATRLADIEGEMRERAERKAVETLEEVNERHRKMLRAIAGKVVKALSELPLATAWEAVRAAKTVIELERLIHGEASQRSELSVAEITRREIETLLVRDDELDGGEW